MPQTREEKNRKAAERKRLWRINNPEKAKAERARAEKKRKEAGYYEKNSEAIFETYLQRKYGIGVDKYNSLLAEQSGVCAICKTECVSGKKLAVDHNHDTGEVRGLLCCKCNRGLGNFADNLDRLQEAVLYLQRYGAEN